MMGDVKRLWFASSVCALSLAACGGGAPPSAPASGPSGLSALPGGTGGAAFVPAALSPASEAPTSSAEEAPSPFVAVAELPYSVRLFAVDGALVAIAEEWSPIDEQTLEGGGMAMGVIEGNRFVEKPSMRFPMSMWPQVVDIRGSWPSGVDLLAVGTTGRTGIAEHWSLTTEGTWKAKRSRSGSFPAGFADVNGSLLLVESPAMGPGSFKPELRVVRGPALVRTQAPIDAACAKSFAAEGAPAFWIPKTKLMPEGLGATRAGTMLAVGGTACSDAASVEVWPPSSATSRIVPLPGEKKPWAADAGVVRGSGADDAWILYGQVTYYDGSEIRTTPPLPSGFARYAAPAADGGVFVVTGEERAYDAALQKVVVKTPAILFQLNAARTAWAEVPLGGASPRGIVAVVGGAVWLSAGTTLYRSRAAATEKSIALSGGLAPGAKTAAVGALRRKLPRPAGPLCPQNLVILYGFTKVTPDDYDFPLTRKAVKGHTELSKVRFVVAKDGGQKFFSAIVPDVGTGKKLVELIERGVAGSKPQLLCADPEILRELPIDLATGEVAKRGGS